MRLDWKEYERKHSSLEAVGLIATIVTKLAADGVSTNVVSGYFHDHIFVPEGIEGRAMGVFEGDDGGWLVGSKSN
jgi:hypothetical protein